jgi:chitin synthase
MRFLSRIHYQEDMNPLELELYRTMIYVIGIRPKLFEFVFMVDADTEVGESSLNQLVSASIRDTKIAGIAGETKLANESDSWVTLIQVYEYFISQHMAKSFESIFGSVTCLPGCFSLYRIHTGGVGKLCKPVLVSKSLLGDYSSNVVDTLHLKNLLHLGEDRYLTTLIIKHFPHMKTKYTGAATCRTVAPDTWRILQSQRRRWINSTVHNLWELMSVNDMCGTCCFSMRFVVLVDLLATLIQPASMLYLGFLIYTLSTDKTSSLPLISLVMIGVIYGLQVILFLLKLEFTFLGWMLAVFQSNLVHPRPALLYTHSPFVLVLEHGRFLMGRNTISVRRPQRGSERD